MPTFRATSPEGMVSEYSAAAPEPAHLGAGWSLAEVGEAQPAPDAAPDTRVFGGRRRLTRLDFVTLLGTSFQAILLAAKQSIEAEVLVKMVEYTTPDPDGTSIDLDDPRIAYGLSQMEGAGVIAAGETERVLHG